MAVATYPTEDDGDANLDEKKQPKCKCVCLLLIALSLSLSLQMEERERKPPLSLFACGFASIIRGSKAQPQSRLLTQDFPASWTPCVSLIPFALHFSTKDNSLQMLGLFCAVRSVGLANSVIIFGICRFLGSVDWQ